MTQRVTYVVIDFDNIPQAKLSLGLECFCENFIDRVECNLEKFNRLVFRLYGGWFLDINLSFSAQCMLKENSLILNVPILYRVNGKKIVYTIEMAYSLLSEPLKLLHSTYREKGYPRGLTMKDPRTSCQANPPCVTCNMLRFYSYFNNNDKTFCRQSRKQLFYKKEQKMVDSMMVADILYLSYEALQDVVYVASSDDDVLPGIVTALTRKQVAQYDVRDYGVKLGLDNNPNFQVFRS